MSDVKTWSDTILEDSMPVVVDSVEVCYTQHDSTRELLAGVEMVELDTIPQDLMDYFK